MPRDSSGPGWASSVLLCGMMAGLLAAVGGVAWSIAAKPSSVWTPEQAAEFKAANDARHAATVADPAANGNGGPSPDSTAMAAAQKRFELISAQLETARAARNRWGQVAAACGLGLTILCGMGYLAIRGEGHSNSSP